MKGCEIWFFFSFFTGSYQTIISTFEPKYVIKARVDTNSLMSPPPFPKDVKRISIAWGGRLFCSRVVHEFFMLLLNNPLAMLLKGIIINSFVTKLDLVELFLFLWLPSLSEVDRHRLSRKGHKITKSLSSMSPLLSSNLFLLDSTMFNCLKSVKLSPILPNLTKYDPSLLSLKKISQVLLKVQVPISSCPKILSLQSDFSLSLSLMPHPLQLQSLTKVIKNFQTIQ